MVATTAVNGINLDNLDQTVSPRKNFYQFANGGWIARNPIPAEYSRWGAFEELNELSNTQLRTILEECVADPGQDPNRRAVAILYASGMDEKACNRNGLSPLADVFAAIDSIVDGPDVMRLVARMLSEMGVNGGLFSFFSLPDAKNSSWEVIMISQSQSIGIGDRDFYLQEDKQDIRDKYVVHIGKMLALSGMKPEAVEKSAQEVMKLETSIAKSCKTKTEMRDPIKTYNHFKGVSDLVQRTKSEATMPWAEYFSLLGLEEEALKTIIVSNPDFIVRLSELLEEVDVNVWKAYLRYHVTKDMADYLSEEVKKEHFSFFGTVMTGQPEMKPRWKRVLSSGVTDILEDSLGMLYTERHFSPVAKKACVEMVDVLTGVLRQRIDEVDWMQGPTKEKAKQKLGQFRALIGYPDKWDVDDVPELLEHISMEKSYAENIRACNRRNFKKVIERIDKAVDANRWEMPSTLVNAYFHPLKNVIVFPAAILQPPFFFHPTEECPYGDPAVNFSAIGAVICHEISYVFNVFFFVF